MTSPDVTVIIPSFNSAAFIRRSVGSALSQNGVDVEIIVIDDEGSDNTRQILNEIQSEHGALKVRLIYRPRGGGQSTARNAGIENARGKYIAFLDSDDQFHNTDTLSKWVRFAESLNLDMACGQYFHVLESTGKTTPARKLTETETPVTVWDAPNLVNITSCWQILYRRSFLQSTDTKFSVNLKQREDRLFVVQAMLAATKIACSGLYVVDHFDVPGSSFKQIDRQQLLQFIQHLKELNQSFSALSSAGNCPERFRGANCALYFIQLFRYWAPLCLSLYNHPDSNALLLQLYEQYGQLAAGVGPMFDIQELELDEQAESILRECTIDMLRLAIVGGQHEIASRILSKRRLGIAEARVLLDGSDATEEVVTRYLSFNRDKKVEDRRPEAKSTLAAKVKRVILHVGTPKTGSSTLQNTLERNRYRLLDCGVYYPISGTFRETGIRRERTPGQARLCQRLLDGDIAAVSELCGEIEALDRPIHTIILSAENIVSPRFWNGGIGYQRILDALGSDNVEVVCVFRRQDKWLMSAYKEMIANPWNGFVAPLEDYIDSLNSAGLFDYKTIMSILSSPSQVRKLHVEAHENLVRNGGILPWFYSLTGLDIHSLAPVRPSLTNASLPTSHVALLRLAKLMGALNRQQMAAVFRHISSLPVQAGVDEYITPAASLERFVSTHNEEIRSFRDHFAVADHEGAAPMESFAELKFPNTLLEMLSSMVSKSALENGGKPTKLSVGELRKIYDKSNAGKVIQLDFKDGAVIIGIARREGEILKAVKLTDESGSVSHLHPLRQEGAAEFVTLQQEALKDLKNQDKRHITILLETNQRHGRRKFEIVRLSNKRLALLPPNSGT